MRRLCRRLDEAQLADASDTLTRYVAMALQVFERLDLDAESRARFAALTASRRKPRMTGEKPPTHPPTSE